MVTVTTQICFLLSALFTLVYSQLTQPIDPNVGSPFGNQVIPGAGFDPNFNTNFNTGAFPTDPNMLPNMFNPGMTGTFPSQQAPLPRPNPMQSMLPMLLFSRGSDMGQMLALSSMMGGGGFGGGGGINPLMYMLMGGMM